MICDVPTSGPTAKRQLIKLPPSGIGGRLASVISPAKLPNAAAAIDHIGEEAGILHVTFVISLIITAVTAIMTLLRARMFF